MASKQLLLHIGTGKTGTTSIQESLHNAGRDGILTDICYPSIDRPDHNLLAVLYMTPERLPREYRSRYQEGERETLMRQAHDFREHLFGALQKSGKTIISSEYLGRFSRKELTALRTDLDRVGVDDIRVVVYVRHPTSAYLSFVQQTLKASSRFRSPEAYHYPFREILETWSEEFADLVVRPFVKDDLAGGDIVSDFAHVASLFFKVDGDLHFPSLTRNRSVSAEAMIVLQRYRQRFHPDSDDEFKWDSGRLFQFLQASEGSFDQTRAVLTPSAEQVVLRRHQEDVEWLAETFGVRLSEGSAKEAAPADTLDGPYQRSRYLDDVTAILATYDEMIVVELLLHCLRQAFKAQRRSTGELSQMRRDISELKIRLRGSRREAALAHRKVKQIQASRSWRWGRRMVLILSSPRKLIKPYRQT